MKKYYKILVCILQQLSSNTQLNLHTEVGILQLLLFLKLNFE